MNHKSATNILVSVAITTAKVFFMLSLLTIAGCDEGKYNVILAIDAKEYRPTMTWEEIREAGFKNKIHGLRVYDADGHPIPLYRYQHESRDVMLLDEAEIAISTPIIIERKYGVFFLSVIVDHNEVAKVRVVISELKSVKGRPAAYVVPLNLP